ncbi:TetR family transcriptional regulator [Mycobacterium sp. CBMA293]|uniref:TetR family transcriptional regulator n=1 Tax=unclassified Mycolicibacterium TaxID=2636767 RepID=UPI0012DCE851|nr:MULTISPECIES: TetR family transcriptional regulator [unclassified Mycolicibacterium]MUL44347.1 TetR family transcriptional regulator [Mycolicibacterium sp. CBMA 360]MUL59665.1 TetR family transcriptional regulator [Mycolicibacterium sp. CBMA 335]MUL68508.1 TetR family transcriptional regulator [Mycolicibacterium sp. CBMA 311]MUL97161.1 TetR family transcriptional regulator [Mycolicibacterium sp. CBMA 230]MUM06347.1 TetR family transcriptional regulator [Mycolicibacterium sp. CBMA 213]
MSEPVSLSERKRTATRERIAAAAAQLVSDDGLGAATIDRIAETAEIGRATFFRYFASKEDAVAEGVTARWLDTITAAIAAQPADLTATEAVVEAFGQLADGFDDIADQIRDLATLTRSSAPLTAWTLNVYVRYENAIADLIAPRLPDLQPQDPRPRLIGALAMASVRIALDDWLIHGGSLPLTVHTALTSIQVTGQH